MGSDLETELFNLVVQPLHRRYIQIFNHPALFTHEVIVHILVGIKTGVGAAEGQLLNLSMFAESL